MKAKARDLMFDGIIIDCTKKDIAAQILCQEIHDKYQEFNLRLVNRNVYAVSLWGAVSINSHRLIKIIA